MSDSVGDVKRIHFRQVCPWLHLFRAFRIALWPPGKLLLAAAAVLLLSAGDWAFSYLPFAPESANPVVWPWEEELGYVPALGPRSRLPSSPHPLISSSSADDEETAETRGTGDEERSLVVLDDPGGLLWGAFTNWPLVLRPLRTLIDPARPLFEMDSSWSEVAYAWTRVLWILLVWSLFGGAISRMAAVQFARDTEVSFWSAVKFSGQNVLSYLTAPLLPLAVFGAFWILCLLGGLLGRIPYVGDVVVAVLWFLPLLFGLAMALILLFLAATWPLMFATVSVEGSDAFDGFSRSYSFLVGRPWHYLWLAVLGMTYGSAVIFVVFLFARLMAYFAGWGVASGMGTDAVTSLYQLAPPLLGMAGGSEAELASAGSPGGFAARVTGFWLHGLAVLTVGFVFSYFWTAVTIIYFLLRQSDDATELNEVFLPEGEESDDLLPFVGVADSDQPTVERPPGQVPAPEPETAKTDPPRENPSPKKEGGSNRTDGG